MAFRIFDLQQVFAESCHQKKKEKIKITQKRERARELGLEWFWTELNTTRPPCCCFSFNRSEEKSGRRERERERGNKHLEIVPESEGGHRILSPFSRGEFRAAPVFCNIENNQAGEREDAKKNNNNCTEEV